MLRLTSEDIGKTFKYKLYEAKGDNKKVTYSDKVYNIEAKISLDENNKPKADLTVNGKEAISVLAKFENVYDSSPIIPITGDRAGIYLWSLMFIFSGVIAVLIYLFYRKAKRS